MMVSLKKNVSPRWPIHVLGLCALVLCMLVTSYPVDAMPNGKQVIPISLGVYQSDKPSVMLIKLKPVLRYLEMYISYTLKMPVKMKLKIFRNYDEARQKLVHDKIDFVRFGAVSYILAKQENPRIQLLAMENRNNSRYFDGVIVVAKHSRIFSLRDLKGKSFAFGNPNSTIGHYLAKSTLVQAGIFAKDLSQFSFLPRHDSVFKSVALGDFEAGAIKENTLKRYNKGGMLRVLHRFKNITKPWIAREKLSPTIVNALKRSLLSLKDPRVLKELKIDGFFPAYDKQYDLIRQQMKLEPLFGRGR